MRMRAPDEVKVRDLSGFLAEFDQETPRASAVLAAAYLDGWLKYLLETVLIDDRKAVDRLLGTESDQDRPLSTFAARISAAYGLGLISKQERDDLELVRRVRNRFAHRAHGYSFDDPEIVGWCTSLQIPAQLSRFVTDKSKGHRGTYQLGIFLLVVALQKRADEAAARHPSMPEEFDAVAYVLSLATTAAG